MGGISTVASVVVGAGLTGNGTVGSPLVNSSRVLSDGQTWQDFSGSRSSGVTYTNTTGRPITLAVSMLPSADNGYVYINGVNIFVGLGRSTYFNTLPATVIVPAGATYLVSAPYSISAWYELR